MAVHRNIHPRGHINIEQAQQLCWKEAERQRKRSNDEIAECRYNIKRCIMCRAEHSSREFLYTYTLWIDSSEKSAWVPSLLLLLREIAIFDSPICILHAPICLFTPRQNNAQCRGIHEEQVPTSSLRALPRMINDACSQSIHRYTTQMDTIARCHGF